jgi:hypothetical protein
MQCHLIPHDLTALIVFIEGAPCTSYLFSQEIHNSNVRNSDKSTLFSSGMQACFDLSTSNLIEYLCDSSDLT